MKPFDDSGRELDAVFSVEPAAGGAALILEARGGGVDGPRLPRNPDYGPALELLLRRLGEAGAVLVDIEVYSRVTRNWPVNERRLTLSGYSLPLDLVTLTNQRDLRLQIGQQSAALGRETGKSGGNSTKRLRLTLRWAYAAGRSVDELESLLSRRDRPFDEEHGDGTRYAPLGAFLRGQQERELRLKLSEIESIIGRALPHSAWTPQFWANAGQHHASRRRQWLGAGYSAFFEKRTETVRFQLRFEKPTADPVEFNKRAARAKARMEGDIVEGSDSIPPPPPGAETPDRVIVSINRHVRDPEVVAWVLVVAEGRCEICGNPAPFTGADGKPFLEVHHVRPLGEGGPDKPDNAVAACPNCHRSMHFGSDRHARREALIAKVVRLRDYPAKDAEPTETTIVTF